MKLKIRLKVFGYMTKRNKPYKRQPAARWPSSAICGGLPFPQAAGRPDNGNHLESGEIRGNMLTRRTLQGICLGMNTLADVLVFDEIPYNPI